jgi:hypothetical protein
MPIAFGGYAPLTFRIIVIGVLRGLSSPGNDHRGYLAGPAIQARGDTVIEPSGSGRAIETLQAPPDGKPK